MNDRASDGCAPAGTKPLCPARTASDGSSIALVRDEAGRQLLYVTGAIDAFHGEAAGGGLLCPTTPENATALADRFNWLKPQRIPEDRTSFGFGDRIGIAGPGHLKALRSSAVFPVLAQQSVRENARTGRTFADVLASAAFAAFREGYTDGFGADADHLKEIPDALEAAKLGFSFFTCDPGDHVEAVERMSAEETAERFRRLVDADGLLKRYADRSFGVGKSLVLHFTEGDVMRAAVKYGSSIDHAVKMYEALTAQRGTDFDYEVSVDETDAPTTPLEHLFVALELRRRGVQFVSLAPRFVGAMEKGVDWRGDIEQFSRDLEQHATIARSIGGYRLSLHSGSDKFSLYPSFARATEGRCHVKTAGTSYLVALEVIALHDPDLFRRLAQHSLQAFAEDKATYHISADPARIPAISDLSDDELVDLVVAHDSRQVLHVAFGSILRGEFAASFRRLLAGQEAAHFNALAAHLGRHIEGLEVTASE